MKTSDKYDNHRVEIVCKTCEKKFETRKSHENRASYCSMRCRKTSKEVRNMKSIVVKAEKHNLTPAQSSKIRGKIARFVESQIEVANDVVMNGKEWTPTQARVFGMLLNKVVPDLNASYVQHEAQQKDITKMTREQLEKIASEMVTIEGEIVEDVD